MSIKSSIAGKLAAFGGMTSSDVADSFTQGLEKSFANCGLNSHPSADQCLNELYSYISSAVNTEEAMHRAHDNAYLSSLAKKYFGVEVS
jgi:hypothetical protein